MRIHYSKLRNMTHILSRVFALLSKELIFIFLFVSWLFSRGLFLSDLFTFAGKEDRQHILFVVLISFQLQICISRNIDGMPFDVSQLMLKSAAKLLCIK